MPLTDKEIIRKYKIKKSDRVLDVGGSMKQHKEILVDTLVDIIRPEKAPYTDETLLAKHFVKADIVNEKFPLKDKEFDFCLCTHTLEDLTNPKNALDEMQRVAKRGYIATPSFGADIVFSHIDFTTWKTGARRQPGNAHHKWLFYKKNKKMFILPKNYPLLYTSEFSVGVWTGEEEFEFYWEGKINYEILTDLNFHAMIKEYRTFFERNKENIRKTKPLIYFDDPMHLAKAFAKKVVDSS